MRKRLASAKRACAFELLAALRDETDERSSGLLKYQLAAQEATEWARAKQVEALVSRHESDLLTYLLAYLLTCLLTYLLT